MLPIFLAVGIVALILYSQDIDSTDDAISDIFPTDTTDTSDNSDDGGTMSNSDESTVMAKLVSAITKMENVPAFHNNPLALTAGAADQVGADYTPNTTGGVVVNFDSLDDGLAAGQAFVQQFFTEHSDLSLGQAIATYTQGPNDPTTISGNYGAELLNYIHGVAMALGASSSTIVGSILTQ